jgi:two-component sensor histidine kinase
LQLQTTNWKHSLTQFHDLRAPLRHINGFARMLIEDHSSQLQPEAQRQLQRIQEGTQKMARMIDDLLSMALEMTSLNSLVENVLHDLEYETASRQIDWRVGSLPSVNCDPGLIQQVFVNLLSNAVQYTRRRERAVIEIDQSIIDGQLVLLVRDNGAGFNPKYSDKLFGTFQRLLSDERHPFHEYPRDYQRWTIDGLRELLSDFEIIDIGLRTGPTATLLSFMLKCAKMISPKRFRRVAYGVCCWLLWPLRYLDVWLMQRPEATTMGNHIYALLRKPNSKPAA